MALSVTRIRQYFLVYSVANTICNCHMTLLIILVFQGRFNNNNKKKNSMMCTLNLIIGGSI